MAYLQRKIQWPHTLFLSCLFYFLGVSANVLYIGGLFPQFRDSDGAYFVYEDGARLVAAAQMAIDRVNNKSDGVFDKLLPNTQLELLVRDTKGQKKQAMTEAFLLNRQENCVGYIGPAFSGPAIEVSNFLSLDPIDRAMISYVATSPQLSDAQFSNFLRTPPSDVIHAKLMAMLMKDRFKWSCANVLIGLGDPYSTAGAAAFESAAREKGINVCTKARYVSGSSGMSSSGVKGAITQIIENRCCLATVVFGKPEDLASLFLEANEQRYAGEWIVGDPVATSFDIVEKELKKKGLDEKSIQSLLTGMFTFGVEPKTTGDAYNNFLRAWRQQPSSAHMLANGTRTGCSDAIDASRRYIWRENGAKNGRCCGIDFQQAARKTLNNSDCQEDPVCASAALSYHVPFVYDAAIALAHGLDRLVDQGINSSDKITAGVLSKAIRESTFEGISGEVSFKSNGDRHPDNLKCIVYNYHPDERQFIPVGRMEAGNVTLSGQIFSDGSEEVPVVDRLLLRIGVLITVFEKNGKQSGSGTKRAHAALLAAKELNERHDILPSYQVEIQVRDTHRDSVDTRELVMDLWKQRVVALVGTSSSDPTATMATMAGISTINLAVVGFRASASTLSDQREYPTFLRVNPVAADEIRSIVNVMQHFDWVCANYVYTPLDSFSTAAHKAFGDITAQITNIDTTVTVALDKEPTEEQYDRGIQSIMNSKCTLTVVVTQAAQIAHVVHRAYKKGYKGQFLMGGAGLSLPAKLKKIIDTTSTVDVNEIMQGVIAVEVFNGDGTEGYKAFSNRWWNQPPTAKRRSDGSFDCSNTTDSTGYYTYRKDGQQNGECWGIDFDLARQQYDTQSGTCQSDYCKKAALSEALPFLRDAVFTVASGLHELLEGKAKDNNSDFDGERLHKVIKQKGFPDGITGTITFDRDSASADRNFSRVVYNVYNFQKKDEKYVRVGTIAAGNNQKFTPCKDLPPKCPNLIFRDGSTDGTSKIPDVKIHETTKLPEKPENRDGDFAGLVVILGVIVLGIIFYLIMSWCKRIAKKKKKREQKELLKYRLDTNWSQLLQADGVDGLSHMPSVWKSGIVPRHSQKGSELDRQLKSISNKIERISKRRCCFGQRERDELDALKKSLTKLMGRKIAPYFTSRHRMYKTYLLSQSSSFAQTIAQSSGGKLLPKEGAENGAEGAVERAENGAEGAVERAENGEEGAEESEIWPQNMTPLVMQIMFLLRDLDNMFKASYNQRFTLRVMNSELKYWTNWAQEELPKMMPCGIVLTQNTSDLFELYRQASEVHSYYNDMFRNLAREIKAEWIPANLKAIFRIMEKADINGQDDFDCSKIFDIVRGTLVCNSMGDVDAGVLRGVRSLCASTWFEVARVKDRFNNPTSACWRDVLINGRMVSRDGMIQSHVVEVQFHQKDLREERMMVGGHFIYERHRALFESCEFVFGENAGKMLAQLHNDLNAKAREERLSNAFQKKRESFIVHMKSQRLSNISDYLSELEIERIPSPNDNTVDNGQKSPSEVPLPNDNSVGDEQQSPSEVPLPNDNSVGDEQKPSSEVPLPNDNTVADEQKSSPEIPLPSDNSVADEQQSLSEAPLPNDNSVGDEQKPSSEVPLPNDNSVGDEQKSSSKVSNDDQVSEKKNKTKKSAAITPL